MLSLPAAAKGRRRDLEEAITAETVIAISFFIFYLYISGDEVIFKRTICVSRFFLKISDRFQGSRVYACFKRTGTRRDPQAHVDA